MKHAFFSLALATSILTALPAAAATYNIEVSGVLTSANSNTGTDPNLSVGSIITLTTSFDSSLLVPWGDSGYSVVGLYSLPANGNSFFRIDGPGVTWKATDSLGEGVKFFSYDSALSGVMFNMALPALIIQGDKVAGIVGNLLPSESSAAPGLQLGSWINTGWYQDAYLNGVDVARSSYGDFGLSDQFTIYAGDNLYSNTYATQGFTGTWDFANSSVVDPPSPGDAQIASAVPEPATWALLLAGLFGTGAMLRRGKRLAHA